MDSVVSIVEVLLAVGAVVTVYLHRRRAVLDHPPLDYTPDAEPWRWGPPPEGLRVHQAEGVSVLELPWKLPLGAVVAELAAYAIGLLILAMMVMGFVNDLPLLAHGVALVIFAPLAWVSLRMSARLWRIELRPDSITCVEKSRLWWRRHRRWRRPVRVSGKMQSAFSLSEGQDPEHDLLISGRLLAVRMRSQCDNGTGSWVVSGLQAWSESPEQI